MASQDIERILDELKDLKNQMTEMKIKLDTHCNTADAMKSGTDWKTYLVFLVSGAIIGMGPTGITLLAKYLGIGG